ncbi:MAG: hypothetical protein M3312_04725 [Actinomycetota bacterium]|nr:hypothetical protein [Actinomycetota bacterium]
MVTDLMWCRSRSASGAAASASIWLTAGRAVFCLMLYALTGAGISQHGAVTALHQIANSGAFGSVLVSAINLVTNLGHA